MSPDTLILPRCSIRYRDLLEVAKSGPNIRQAADRLGVDYFYLVRVLKVKGLRHLFPSRETVLAREHIGEDMGLSREDVQRAADLHYVLADAAEFLGCSVAQLCRMKARWGIAWHNQGEGSVLARGGELVEIPAVKLEQLAARGLTRTEAAVALNVSVATVRRFIKKHDVCSFPSGVESRRRACWR